MTNSKTLYFRPIDTRYIEETRVEGIPTYTIVVKVAYFLDQEQTQKVYEDEKTYEHVPYTTEWDGALATVYNLVNSI